MKCLVTGGAGFIGSHLVDRLVEAGHEVVVWDALTTGLKRNLNEKVRSYVIHCQDAHPPKLANNGHEIIFHLAAEARIQPSFDHPSLVHDSNVTGTLRMLELCRLTRAKMVFAGSSSTLSDPWANPYTFSKSIGESYCKMYASIYGVSVKIARFFNVYGPRQMEDGPYATVVGIFERQKREGKPLTVTGDGEQRRDFIHVSDVVSGLLAMATQGNCPGEVQLGSGVNYSINEVAKLFGGPVEYLPARPGEARCTLAHLDIATTRLGWKPEVSLEEYITAL